MIISPRLTLLASAAALSVGLALAPVVFAADSGSTGSPGGAGNSGSMGGTGASGSGSSTGSGAGSGTIDRRMNNGTGGATGTGAPGPTGGPGTSGTDGARGKMHKTGDGCSRVDASTRTMAKGAMTACNDQK